MELRHLRYFVAVAEELHFGRAAARLHISQPPLSKQIQQLEQELNVKLLMRNKHKVELTPAGSTFLSYARQLLSGMAEAVEVARRVDRGEIAQLRIGHTHSADLKALPRLLSAFRMRYDRVGITLRRSNAPDLVAGIHRHEFDLGVIRLPASCHGLKVIPICRETLIVALPTNHPLADCCSVPVSALEGEPQILFPRHHAPGYFDLLARICERAGFVMKVSQVSDSIQSTLSLVSMGFGVSFQPECVRDLARAGVAFRSLEGDVPPLDMALICRPDDSSEIVACLISLAEELRNQFCSKLEPRRQVVGCGLGSE